MSLRTTLDRVFGSAWHTNHKNIFDAMFPATDGTVEASKPIVADANKTVSGLLGWLLGAGTATQAPTTMTAGTNLTTAAAGAVEFDGTCFYDTAAASSRQVRNDEQYCILTADYTATDSAPRRRRPSTPRPTAPLRCRRA
jgi:hypothetical protein